VSDCTRFSADAVVLDTQVLLDWRFFGSPACAAWRPPSTSTWRWLATPAMRDELAHVLARGFPARWQTPAEQVLAFFDAHATLVEPPAAANFSAPGLRCTDPDDQKFIDLALALRPAMLVSRDRAVLKLARRAAAHGVSIVPPQRWQLTATAAAMPP
jgi:predicted nucleic acid-binding protein